MSKFNAKRLAPKSLTVNRAGGEAYEQSPELQLISLLLCSFVKDQYYETAGEAVARLRELATNIKDKVFLAKSAVYARDKFNMRSITHALAAEVAHQVKGPQKSAPGSVVVPSWIPSFIDKVVVRVDDATEILSYYLRNCSEKVPNNLKKGLGKALGKFDSYALGKYRGEGKDLKLVDLVNLVHPKPTERNKSALEALVKGTLKSVDTWERKLSDAGQTAKTLAGEDASEEQIEEIKADLKRDSWLELIRNRKLGYFALLRNLRNIASQAPEVLSEALKMLKDRNLIKKSRVLPFRFATAYREFSKAEAGGSSYGDNPRILEAISEAAGISLDNVPELPGKTVVVLDLSGSMCSHLGAKDGTTPADIGSLFAAILVKKNKCDLIQFHDKAWYKNVNPADSLLTLQQKIAENPSPSGTNFHAPIKLLNKKYDRIIILSDQQGWIKAEDEYIWRNTANPASAFKEYKKKFDADPFVFSWDLTGYGDMMFPENNVFCLAGFSDKAFDLMKLLESDRKALISEINKVEL